MFWVQQILVQEFKKMLMCLYFGGTKKSTLPGIFFLCRRRCTLIEYKKIYLGGGCINLNFVVIKIWNIHVVQCILISCGHHNFRGNLRKTKVNFESFCACPICHMGIIFSSIQTFLVAVVDFGCVRIENVKISWFSIVCIMYMCLN